MPDCNPRPQHHAHLAVTAERPVLSAILPGLLDATESSGTFARHFPLKAERRHRLRRYERLRLTYCEEVEEWLPWADDIDVDQALQEWAKSIKTLDVVCEDISKAIIVYCARWALRGCPR